MSDLQFISVDFFFITVSFLFSCNVQCNEAKVYQTDEDGQVAVFFGYSSYWPLMTAMVYLIALRVPHWLTAYVIISPTTDILYYGKW